MNDGFGNPIYIFNPFTYEELHQKAGPPGTIDKYLRCISEMQMPTQNGDDNNQQQEELCEKPSVPEIDEQGVGIIALIERCRSNYHQQQWDVGAFMLYDSETLPRAVRYGGFIPTSSTEDANNNDDDETAACLLQAQENQESNVNCMMVLCIFLFGFVLIYGKSARVRVY